MKEMLRLFHSSAQQEFVWGMPRTVAEQTHHSYHNEIVENNQRNILEVCAELEQNLYKD